MKVHLLRLMVRIGCQHGEELVQVLQVLRRRFAADPAVI
jgi:hypothetical protein